MNKISANENFVQTDFELSGLDADELEWMDSGERRETLENVGLDPDDCDF